MRSRTKPSNRLLACAALLVAAGPAAAQTAPSSDIPPAQKSWADTYGWYGLDAPTSTEYELDEIFAPHTGMFKVPLLDDPMNWLIRQQQELFDRTGLRIGMSYTGLYQQATGGPGDRSASGGDIDLMFDWTLLGRGTKNTGRFVFTVEERYKSCEIPPSQLRNEIGSLVATTGAFNDRGLVVRDAFWDQRLFEDRLRILVGRAAPDDYAGSHRLQSSVFGFFNGNLSGNVTTPWPGHGPLALVSVRPVDEFYVTAGACNAYSTTTQIQITSLDEGKIFGFGEAGFTPMIEGMGRGRYALTAWYMPSREDPDRPSDTGLSVTAEQYLTEIFWVMGRFGCAANGSTGVEQGWSGAMAVDGLLGSPDNVTALGVGYAKPTNGSLRDEFSVDLFHRFQVTEHTQFTVGGQVFFDPSNAPDTDVVGVFSFRLRVDL